MIKNEKKVMGLKDLFENYSYEKAVGLHLLFNSQNRNTWYDIIVNYLKP